VSGLVHCVGLVWLYLRDHKVHEGPEGIVLYPIRGKLSNCEWGLKILFYIQEEETYGKERHMI
jgi:hypothetical protein